MSLKVVFATMAIYLTCSMIDALRIYLFKVCSIYKYCDNFSDYLEQKRWGGKYSVLEKLLRMDRDMQHQCYGVFKKCEGMIWRRSLGSIWIRLLVSAE